CARSAVGGETDTIGREQSGKADFQGNARGAGAPRSQDGPRPPNGGYGRGAADVSISAGELCAADLFATDLFATDLFATDLYMGRWHRPGCAAGQAGADQAASHGEEGDAGRTGQSFNHNRGLKRHPITACWD